MGDEIKSGKHAGRATEEILLKKPDVAEWYLKNRRKSRYAKDFKRLIKIFNHKPFFARCERCFRKATVAYGKIGGDVLTFRCARCYPDYYYSDTSGIVRATPIIWVLDTIAPRNRRLKRRLVWEVALAKGLPEKVGKREALAFFSSST